MSTRLIAAGRILGQIVAGGGIGTAATATADLRELAATATPAKDGISQILEHLGVSPEVRERREPEVARGHRQVRTRRHVSVRGDAAVVLSRRTGAMGVVAEQRRRRIDLVDDAAEVRGTLGPDEQPLRPAQRRRPRILEAFMGFA
jgi:hypothetical protein